MPNNDDNSEKLKEEVKKLNSLLEKLSTYAERVNLHDYLLLLQSPLRLIYLNFLAGMFRGLGIALGMTFLFGLLILILTKLVNLPLIGEWIAGIVKIVNQELKK